jgi:hypothetical protein
VVGQEAADRGPTGTVGICYRPAKNSPQKRKIHQEEGRNQTPRAEFLLGELCAFVVHLLF